MMKKYLISLLLLFVGFVDSMDHDNHGLKLDNVGTYLDDESCTSPLTVSYALTPITPEREKNLRSNSINPDHVVQLIEQEDYCTIGVEETLLESWVQISPYRQDMAINRRHKLLVQDTLDGMYYDKYSLSPSDVGRYLNKPSMYKDKKKACFEIDGIIRTSVASYAKPLSSGDITKIVAASAVLGGKQVSYLESWYQRLLVDQGTPETLGVSMTGHLAPLRRAINEIETKK